MALLPCACRHTIDTATAQEHDGAFQCGYCGAWKFWTDNPGELDYNARARLTQVEVRLCPHGCGKAHEVQVGALGTEPSTVYECSCITTEKVDNEEHYVYAWRDDVRVREKVVTPVVRTYRRTFTAADLLLRGKLVQTRPLPIDPEAAMRASKVPYNPTMARVQRGG